MIKRWVGGMMMALCLSLQAQATTPVQSVNQVDVSRYMGTWYEIARFPMYFQRHCARDVTATYQLNTDQSIRVDNRCIKANGQMMQAVGVARAVNSQKSQLKVSFLPKWLQWLPVGEGDYWVLKLDVDYQTVLVGSPNRKYLWILARQPQIPEQTYLDFVDAARNQGFDIRQLQRTVQSQR